MPHGKYTVPLSNRSIPVHSGQSSGSVPFVCKLSPLQPGYVMTVCAVAVLNTVAAANTLAKLYILLFAHSRQGKRALSRRCIRYCMQSCGLTSFAGVDTRREYVDNWLRRAQGLREMGGRRVRESCTCAAYSTVHDPACQCSDRVIGAHACSDCSLGRGLRAGWTVGGCRSGISARLNVCGCGPEALTIWET